MPRRLVPPPSSGLLFGTGLSPRAVVWYLALALWRVMALCASHDLLGIQTQNRQVQLQKPPPRSSESTEKTYLLCSCLYQRQRKIQSQAFWQLAGLPPGLLQRFPLKSEDSVEERREVRRLFAVKLCELGGGQLVERLVHLGATRGTLGDGVGTRGQTVQGPSVATLLDFERLTIILSRIGVVPKSVVDLCQATVLREGVW